MLDTICTLPLPSDLFALALHPTEPILTVGLSSGHVYTYRLPSSTDDSPPPDSSPPPSTNGTDTNGARRSSLSSYRRSSSASESGLGSIATLWSTRRHHGSCRALAFAVDGNTCFSAGTDGIVKHFDTFTGKVRAKYVIPVDETGDVDAPTVVKVVGQTGLLIATDSGRLHLLDIRPAGSDRNMKVPTGTWKPHEDEHINDIVLLPASENSTSGVPKSCVSIGGTTLAVTDFRKGVVARSESQEIELTSVAFVDGLKKGGTSVGEKVLVGQIDGIVGLWERGVWGDVDERIYVDSSGPSIECLVEVPLSSGLGKGKLKINEKLVAAGLEDGRIRFLRVGRNGTINEWDIKHDDVEGVVSMGFDVTGRLVSGGGQTVKVWTEALGAPGGGNGKSNKREREDSDDEEEAEVENGVSGSDEDEDDESSDEDKLKSKRKRRKRNKGRDKSGGQALKFSGIL